ncbi:hypothetical protein ABDK56_07610 [Sphingomonas sp. ASV193]|uniref:hypothetical protein n=1 Tax=Sphingomonas sp. ASV193 TaxID=3144405 RepID=UPI0032E88FD7
MAALKKSVDMGAPRVRGSRIRRDPPPKPERVLSRAEIREHDQRRMIMGIGGVAIALFAILLGLNTSGIQKITDWKLSYSEPARR